MATFTITYQKSTYDEDTKTEDVKADDYVDEGEWITFRQMRDASGHVDVQQVLRVRSKDVNRIDRKD
jgi:hypothetical protein